MHKEGSKLDTNYCRLIALLKLIIQVFRVMFNTSYNYNQNPSIGNNLMME